MDIAEVSHAGRYQLIKLKYGREEKYLVIM